MKIWHSIDWLLFLLILIIVIFGSAILLSINSFSIPEQPFYLLLSFLGFFLASRLDYRIFKGFALFFYLLSFVLLILTLFLGGETRGASRWIALGFITFQPSELIKPLLIFTAASFALKLDLKNWKDSFIFFAIFFPLLFLVFRQPDLGNTVVYLLIFISVFYISGGNLFFLLFSFFLLGFSFPLLWCFLKDYQRQRIFSFLQPASDPLGAGYNLIQAIVTVGSGGFLGRGLGIGTQSQLKFLPERSTDFIFASLAEQLGFIGSLVLILAFLLLLFRILSVGSSAKDDFGKNIAFGIFSMVFFQALINIGMNLGIAPITGVTLPLVSQGGSSLLATMICLGVLSNIFIGKRSI